MDAFLSDQWLAGASTHEVLDAASVTLLQREVRVRAAQLGMSDVVSGCLANIVSELGHNQLAHARVGRIGLRSIEREGVPGLEIIAADAGTGLTDPTTALAGVPRAVESSAAAKTSLGVGLAAVRELSDEVDFDVRLLEGTCVWARKFAARVNRRREVGIYGRPCPGEDVSGDQALFVRDQETLLLGLLDGLGHGPAAREASDAAVHRVVATPAAALPSLFTDCHAALQKTRGAVMTLSRVHEAGGELEAASMGNVTLYLAGPGQSKRMSGSSWVVGSPGIARKPSLDHVQLAQHDAIVLFTDGLTGRLDLGQELDLLREHPIVIAQQVLTRFSRNNDDALVLVAR